MTSLKVRLALAKLNGELPVRCFVGHRLDSLYDNSPYCYWCCQEFEHARIVHPADSVLEIVRVSAVLRGSAATT